MLLTCPQCETIFRVGRLRLHPAGYAKFCAYLHKFRLPVIAVLICAGLMTSLIKGRGILTAYFPGLIAGFHRIGLPILPPIDTLLVVNLDGSYAGEMLRHCGFGSRVQMG